MYSRLRVVLALEFKNMIHGISLVLFSMTRRARLLNIER